jgi:hypothetical protein
MPNPFVNPPLLGNPHPLFLDLPFYLLGIPPLRHGAIPIHSDPWLAVYRPPLFAPHSLFPFPQRSPISNKCPPTTTLRHRLHIVRTVISHQKSSYSSYEAEALLCYIYRNSVTRFFVSACPGPISNFFEYSWSYSYS